jgi:holo-ACP synthase
MNEIDMDKFKDILNSREERANKQFELLKKYPNTLISFTLNIPGIIKNSKLYTHIHENGMNTLVSTLKYKNINIFNIETCNKKTGSEGFISVDSNPVAIKELTVDIEDNHPLGRVFDIDVFDKNHNQISRSNLNLDSRKCLICSKDAQVCMREKNHTYEELINKIEVLAKDYLNL